MIVMVGMMPALTDSDDCNGEDGVDGRKVEEERLC